METATPSRCVHLFVPSWGLAHSYNQPPAMLRLEGKGVQAHPLDGSLATQLQYSCLDKIFHGQRRLMGYSPWLSKESDTTE